MTASLRKVLVLTAGIIGTIDATPNNRPVLSITVRDGDCTNENYLDYFCPTVSAKYATPGKDPFPVDIQYGYFVTPSTQRPSCSIWGKASQNISGWRITAAAALAAVKQHLTKHNNNSIIHGTSLLSSSTTFKADVDMRAENTQNDLSARIFASDGNIHRIELTKGFTLSTSSNNNNDRFTINPRYNPQTNAADVILGYSTLNTSVKLRASPQSQEISIAQQINESNVIIPSITNTGDVSVRWEKQLQSTTTTKEEEGGYIATTLKPNEAIHVQWKDGLWNVDMNVPMDYGTDVKRGMHVGIRREVVF